MLGQLGLVVLEDIVEGTRRRRLDVLVSLRRQEGFQGRPRRCVFNEISHSLPCNVQPATPGELQLPSIFVMDVLN